MNAFLKSLIPPALLNLRQREKVELFPTYWQALAKCSTGYSDHGLLEVILAKTLAYRNRIGTGVLDSGDVARMAIPLGYLRSDHIRVLDFGGACGAHCYLARHLFPGVKLRWAVVETEGMAKIAASYGDKHLSFHSTISGALTMLNGVDLVISSGTLQCLPHPLAGLKDLMAINAPHLWLTRVKTTAAKQIFIQRTYLSENGPGPLPPGFTNRLVAYPRTELPASDYENVLATRYDIKLRIDEGHGMRGWFNSLAQVSSHRSSIE